MRFNAEKFNVYCQIHPRPAKMPAFVIIILMIHLFMCFVSLLQIIERTGAKNCTVLQDIQGCINHVLIFHLIICDQVQKDQP